MIAIVDYGMGNLRSIHNALDYVGGKPRITARPQDLEDAAAVVLPGVGAFSDAMRALRDSGMVEVMEREVLDKGKPFLGICLGMQLLARESDEGGLHAGLGWIDARVERIRPDDPTCKVPHMGWNNVTVLDDGVLFKGLKDENVTFYFVHSYQVVPDAGHEDMLTMVSWHGCRIHAALRKDNIMATQFHPEKSQMAGIKVLSNFVDHVTAEG